MRLAVLALLLASTTVARADEAADLDAFAKSGTGCDKARAHCFGLQLHVAHVTGGDGFVVTPAWVAEQVANAQAQFAAIDVGWDIVGADAVAADKLETLHSREDRSALVAKGMSSGVVDVFFTGQLDDVDDPTNLTFGVTWRAPNSTRKYIIVSGKARPRTLAHELGHFFGLPHSTYAISIMNKTPRDKPAIEERRFHDNELAAMKPIVKQHVKDRTLVERKH